MDPPMSTASASHPEPAIDLHHVKSLFLRKQYRQAITACQSLLKTLNSEDVTNNPNLSLRKSFCLFYLAAAHDDLAWAMHRSSSSRLPAFTTAELFYQRALDALPATSEMYGTPDRSSLPRPRSTRYSVAEESLFRRSFASNRYSASISEQTSQFPIPPRYNYTASTPRPLSSMSIPRSISELDETQHDTATREAPATSRRSLTRDYSRMSLVDPSIPPVPQRNPARHGSRPSASTSSSRPAEDRHGNVDEVHERRADLPKIVTSSRVDSGLPSASSSRFVSPEPGSDGEPVSPLAPEESWEKTDISPVSPERASFMDAPWSPSAGGKPDTVDHNGDRFHEDVLEEPNKEVPVGTETHSDHTTEEDRTPPESADTRATKGSASLVANLDAFRTQLDTHISIVREQLNQVRASRARALKNKSVAGSSPPSPPLESVSGGLQQARSYWLFVPAEVRAEDIKQRIRAGKERNWTRDRFQHERYQILAENALVELQG